MDERILDLLRDLASDLEEPDPYGSPISDISDLGNEAVPSLIQALRHGEPPIRRMAAYAFGLLAWPNERRLDLKAAVSHLQQALKTDSDTVVRRQAAEALWHICEDDAALQAFLAGLSDEDVEARRWGAIMLGLVGEKAPIAIQPLIDALDDPDLIVRRYVAEALATHGAAATSALPNLEALLGEDEWTRVIGTQAILTIAPSRTAGLSLIVAEALKSRSTVIRRQAAEALSELSAPGRMAIPELIDAIDDEDEAVRMMALQALENLGTSAAPAVPKLVRIFRGEGRDGDDVLVRGQAADVLASVGEEAQETVFFLLESLDEPGDDDMTVHFRFKVAHALWHISGEPGLLLTRAVELLSNPNWWLRYRAAVGLGDLGTAGRAAIPHLRQALKDDHPTVRRSAAESLERIAGS